MDSNSQTTKASAKAPALLKNSFSDSKSRFKAFVSKTFGEYGYLLIAAAIPAVLFYLIYLISQGIYPFGDGSVLVLDLSGQYVSFYEGLYDILHGEADLLYSFSRNLGGEFLGIYDYYVASPFAMLLALLPQRFMLEGLLLLFLLKAALCAFNMGFFLHKHASGDPKKLVIIAFSVMYAMSSYCVVQQHNSMWIDAVLWLPLLALGIESLIKYGKFRLYVFALAITIHSNFYIGYMTVIFTVIYCFYYYFAHNRNNENNPLGEKNHFVKSVARTLGWSVLAVGIAALAILSARYALSFGKNEFSNPSWEITQKFNLLDLLYKFLPSSFDSVRPDGLPFVYCGVLTLITVPAFFLCKKFSNREKIAAGIVILVLVGSMATSVVDLIWHGFQKPNWLNYRYSFMLCFFLLMLGYKAFDRIEYVSRKALLGVTANIGIITLILYTLRDHLFLDLKEDYAGMATPKELTFHPFATIWLALGCLFAYFVIVALMGRVKARKRETLSLVLVLIVCVEVFLSGLSDMASLDYDVGFTKHSKYTAMIDTLRPITDTIDKYDDGFYRMEKTYWRKSNDNYALGIKGLTCSTSTLNRDTIDFLRSMGYVSRSHESRYLGGTPVNDSLLGIKYIITNEDESHYYNEPILTPEDYGYDEDFDLTEKYRGSYNVYENPYALSFVYGVADGWMDFDYEDYNTPFERLNAMVTVMLGEEETVEIFKPATQNGSPTVDNIKTGTAEGHLSYKKKDTDATATLLYNYTVNVPVGTELYFFYPTNYLREVALSTRYLTGDDELDKDAKFSSNGTFGGSASNCIVSLGQTKSENLELKVKLQNTNNNLYVLPKDSYIYYIDQDVMKDALKRLAEIQLAIDTTSSDSHITGKVKTSSDRQLMFTSIPYDAGWNIYVDGEKVETLEANNSLVAFYVDGTGEHTVELKYMPREIALGIGISVTCLVIFVLLLIAYPFIKKVPVLRKLVMIEGDELPAIADEEYRAGIEPGDIGDPSLYGDDTDNGGEDRPNKKKKK